MRAMDPRRTLERRGNAHKFCVTLSYQISDATISWGLREIAKDDDMRKLLMPILAALLFVGFSTTGYAASNHEKCMEKCKNYAGGTNNRRYTSCVGHYCTK
ncbi:MAG: hypothetical protein ACRD9W_10105 [Terriglobia bacterium]